MEVIVPAGIVLVAVMAHALVVFTQDIGVRYLDRFYVFVFLASHCCDSS